MATYLYACDPCGTTQEERVATMEPPTEVRCPTCSGYTRRVYSPPYAFTHQTGADWLNEVAEGRGDPPAGMTQQEGKRAALAKSKSDRQMAHQSGKQPKTISTGTASAMKPYTPE